MHLLTLHNWVHRKRSKKERKAHAICAWTLVFLLQLCINNNSFYDTNYTKINTLFTPCTKTGIHSIHFSYCHNLGPSRSISAFKTSVLEDPTLILCPGIYVYTSSCVGSYFDSLSFCNKGKVYLNKLLSRFVKDFHHLIALEYLDWKIQTPYHKVSIYSLINIVHCAQLISEQSQHQSF